MTLKHFAVNTLENTAPWLRTTFNANASFGVGWGPPTIQISRRYYIHPQVHSLTKRV